MEKLPVWKLETLFDGLDDPRLLADMESMNQSAGDFAQKWRGKLASVDAAGLLEALKDYERALFCGLKAYTYAHLRFAQNSGNEENVALSAKIRRLMNEARRKLIFFTLELDGIDDERFAKLSSDAILAPYRHYLNETRKGKPHRLSEPEENILTMKALTGKNAFVELYSRLTSAFRFPDPLGGEGEKTGSEILALLKHPDHEVRRKAVETYMDAYKKSSTVISSVWNALAVDHAQNNELRGYGHPMEAVNEENELPGEVVVAILDVSREYAGLARRYYKWKAGALGVEKLRSCDLVAPLPGEEVPPLPFEKSKALVLEAFAEFSAQFHDIALAFFDEGRVDAPPMPGKSGGAFCMGVAPGIPVYVLMNYTGKLRDAATLAHELGHGVHFTLAQDVPMLEYGPVLPMAETASVFAELLLNQKLAKADLSSLARRNLLAENVEDIIATTFRQAMYTDFELAAHQKIAQGNLSFDDFSALWAQHLDALYGDSVETLEASKVAWSAIPHFIHTRFYCYAYTFGELLVLALFKLYKDQGSAFVPKMTAILSAGGSKAPADLMQSLGLDLADRNFWAGGYEMLSDMLDELEKFAPSK